MAAISLLRGGGAVPGPGTRILRAAEYSVLARADEALAQARRLADECLRQAEEAREERRREGYAAGLAEGKEELAARLLDAVGASVEQMSAMEGRLVDVVVQSIRAVLGSFDRGDLACQVVANALRLVRDEKKILLRVPLQDAEAVQGRLEEMTRRYPGMGRVDVAPDPALAPGGCVLETEIGVVDASLERQLALMEEAFRRQLEARAGHGPV